MKGKKIRQLLYDAIPTGRDNAITGRTLKEFFNLRARDITSMIESGRRAGIPICASVKPPYGYYRASNKEENEKLLRELVTSFKRNSQDVKRLQGDRIMTNDKDDIITWTIENLNADAGIASNEVRIMANDAQTKEEAKSICSFLKSFGVNIKPRFI